MGWQMLNETIPAGDAQGVSVSVILTSFNYGRYLPQAIESVLQQTYQDFQLIVVDDGSTDESRDILRTYSDPRITVLLQENAGQGPAWNRAFEMVSGDLVLFLDSDDHWKPHKIDVMVRCHQLLGGSYGVMQHNLTAVRDGKEYSYRRTLRSGNCFEEMRVTGNINYFVTSSGLGFPSAVLRHIFPLPTSLRISPDAYLTRAAFTFGDVFSIPEELGYLRLHGKNAGMTQDQAFHDNIRREFIFPALNEFYKVRSIPYEYTLPRRRWYSAVMDRIRRLV
jgi:glycosyltransferase involved in cell wall biosynthesis